ncbi:MAG: response regulator transcription factor [Bacteroidetes bacterium]|nr:response regulator transcription factor [Bacteroidota bacterium]MBS1930158.1 response regulator transcription factor [Bacteroidota bacterium]
MEPLKAILVDDEFSSLQNLHQKLNEFCPDVKVVATAQKPEDAILLIQQHRPDVIFLDIEMPRMNGFRMLDELGEYDFDIIFTTAYNHYAVDAIRISAFDYLTKPIAIKDLQNAVERLIRQKKGKTKDQLDVLRQSFSPAKSQEEKIAIPTHDGLEFMQIKNIIHIESSSNYSKLFLTDGKSILVTRLLKEFEDILHSYNFFRIHNSHLINLSYVKKYIRGEGGQVIMQNGDVIDVSRRKKEEFLKIFSS